MKKSSLLLTFFVALVIVYTQEAVANCIDHLSLISEKTLTISTDQLKAEVSRPISHLNEDEILNIEFIQDLSFAKDNFSPTENEVPLGPEALTLSKQKFAKTLNLVEDNPNLPDLTKMELSFSDFNSEGKPQQVYMHSYVRVRRKYLIPILNSFIKSLSHPGLGNLAISADVKSIEQRSAK